MQKLGFTLQEILISLAIIGITAAIVAPSLQRVMPDDTKAKYIKAYNILSTQLVDILEDNSLYYTTYNNNGIANCSGLSCNETPVVVPYNTNTYRGINKFPQIFASRLNLAGAVFPGVVNGQGNVSFVTQDGIGWHFVTIPTFGGGQTRYTTNVVIDIDANNANGNLSTSANPNTFVNNNLTPDCFRFQISNDGTIEPNDPLGLVYLQNPTKLNFGKEDKELAKKLVARNKTDKNEWYKVLLNQKNSTTTKEDGDDK